jgi:hypothetical protein
MDDNFIDYGKLIDDAMHIIVRKALETVSDKGLPGKHHFFISFVTGYPGVVLSKELRDKYPEEMTIVLQHQFEDLKVTDERFDVVLSFDNVKEKIGIPFEALVAFADPSIKFGLQFRRMEELEEDHELRKEISKPNEDLKGKKKQSTTKKAKNEDNVVDIGDFRKNKLKD